MMQAMATNLKLVIVKIKKQHTENQLLPEKKSNKYLTLFLATY